MDPRILDKLQAIARGHGWPALLLFSPENVAYSTGLAIPSHAVMRWRHAICIIPAEGQACMVVVNEEAGIVRDHLPEVEVVTYAELTDDPMHVLADTLLRMGAGSALMGIELDYLPAGDALRLERFLPNARWGHCERGVADARMTKTPAEIETLRALSRLTDAAIFDALASVRAGMTEMDIAAGLTRGIVERGADTFKLMVVASGRRSGYPNVGPTHRVLKPGDLIRCEIFGVRHGYHAGVCRTATVGEPSEDDRRVWSILIRCRDVVLQHLKPGASTAEIYRLFLEAFKETGGDPISFVGHGIGVHLQEAPHLGAGGDWKLQPGMVLGIGPSYYAHGRGMHNKDMVLVTKDGCELLSNVTPAEELISLR